MGNAFPGRQMGNAFPESLDVGNRGRKSIPVTGMGYIHVDINETMLDT